MAKKLDQIIVVDVEATCWEGEPPEGQDSEIIEIGICPIDVATAEPLEKRSILVKPEKSTVSDFCTTLTTLTQDDVEKGIAFKEACRILKKEYRTKHRAWASYGDYDRRQFERQCLSWNISYPFGATHINVKNLFAIAWKLPREVGMAEALKTLDLPLEGIHHRGEDDAWNIARILSELVVKMRVSL
ncbi:MAG: DNA polymerase III [Candidatus Aminicenantes bacterium]|nr:DNA polymerase III [Candidatus Aminicenantes bacterium]NIM79597.1 DNA polymerase III [Candidatus Aminicenantes bacterium]NIN18909.1 DNA polymerase III [Candidatus Aminicenantes bacterium]NIN42819.1 DNA polymerase III [Candidatus Aminicenantes bacterium]NIN85546.1 DNA polymerase III [Candidatus Aminicenantes bacterium]